MPSATSSPLAGTQPTSTQFVASHADNPPFPPPSSFSILPDLYLLISRLSTLQQLSSSSVTTNSATSQSIHHPSQLSNDRLINPLNLAPIEPKQLPLEVYPIKQKIAKAKAAITALPDVGRSIEEQEAEIRMLEGKARGLRSRLALFGKIAGNNLKNEKVEKEEVMEGVEDG